MEIIQGNPSQEMISDQILFSADEEEEKSPENTQQEKTKQEEEEEKEAEIQMTCLICFVEQENPEVCLACQRFFCKSCVNEWKQKNNECPMRCNTESWKTMEYKELKDLVGHLQIKNTDNIEQQIGNGQGVEKQTSEDLVKYKLQDKLTKNAINQLDQLKNDQELAEKLQNELNQQFVHAQDSDVVLQALRIQYESEFIREQERNRQENQNQQNPPHHEQNRLNEVRQMMDGEQFQARVRSSQNLNENNNNLRQNSANNLGLVILQQNQNRQHQSRFQQQQGQNEYQQPRQQQYIAQEPQVIFPNNENQNNNRRGNAKKSKKKGCGCIIF